MGQFFFFKFFTTLRTISVNFGQNLVKNRVDLEDESQQCLQCCEIGHESQPVRHRISKSRPYIIYIFVWTQYTDPLSNLPAVHRYTVFKQKCILYTRDYIWSAFWYSVPYRLRLMPNLTTLQANMLRIIRPKEKRCLFALFRPTQNIVK